LFTSSAISATSKNSYCLNSKAESCDLSVEGDKFLRIRHHMARFYKIDNKNYLYRPTLREGEIGVAGGGAILRR